MKAPPWRFLPGRRDRETFEAELNPMHGLLNDVRRRVRKLPGVYYPLKQAQRSLLAPYTRQRYQDRAKVIAETFSLTPKPVKKARGGPALIEITNACNLNCKMCNTKSSTRPASLMSPDDFELILVKLKHAGIASIALHTVGETFVYRKLESLLEIARRHGFEVRLSTNAQFPERLEEVYRAYPDIANVFRFSIDGATKETFEDIRVNGNFEKVIECLEVVHRINDGRPNSRIFLNIDAVISMVNFHEIPLFFQEFGRYLWVEYMNFWLINGLSPDDTYFFKTFPFPNLIRHSAPCHQPFDSMHFTYDGLATMCCRDYNGDLTVGDIHEKTYDELWNSAEAEAIRAQHVDPETLTNKACKNCYMPYTTCPTVSLLSLPRTTFTICICGASGTARSSRAGF
jgi:radical SAM protein with 4Fe4S-binding SPASM domain